jgi:nitroreductase
VETTHEARAAAALPGHDPRARFWQESFDDYPGYDLWKVIGDRRSIRYFLPYRPVERWKVEMIFQAAHRSSRAINGSFIKTVAVERDAMDPATREALKTPTNTGDLDMAPLYLFTYANKQAALGGPERLKDLYDRGAFAPALGWSHRFIEKVVDETILQPLARTDEDATWIGSVEAAQAIAHMLLMITALGLGACCKSFVADAVKETFKVPDHFHPIWMILVGYPAEHPQAGGQRPRPPLEDDYFWGDFETPFEPTEDVTAELYRRKLLQPQAPYPWRHDEIRYIARAFGLPEE